MDPSVPGEALLQAFIAKTLRVTTKDTRMFVGELKCTDREANLILSQTHEYRLPKFKPENVGRKLDLSSRFLGLVVVMGGDIQKIEVENMDLDGFGEGASGSDTAMD